jgi:beta-glucosidase
MDRFRCLLAFSLLVPLAGAARADFTPPSVTQLDPKIEALVDGLLKQLTVGEKIDLISGTDIMHTAGVPRLGIPALKFSDGPVGVRCWGKTTAYPAGALLASTWDPDMALAEGVALGRDARSRGVDILLAPGMNIYREAQNGRNFEYLGEDPCLASAMAVNYVRGVQSQGVAACVKHFVANGQEWNRFKVDTIVSRRALEEIYFPPFKAAIQQGNAWTAMAAYNKVNGEWCTANKFLLTDVLRDEWHFHGLLMSDWGAVHDTEKALNAGTDLEMHDKPRLFYNQTTIPPLLASGVVSQATLDEHVRRLLRTMVAMGFLDRDQTDTSIPRDDPQNAAAALKVASEGIVLLKNEGHLLPLDRAKVHHIVVTGPNGQHAVIGGGGSSGTGAFTEVSVLEGVRQAAGPGVQVDYIPDLSTFIFSRAAFSPPAPAASGQIGLHGDYFNNPTLSGTPVETRLDRVVDFDWNDANPVRSIKGGSAFSVRWTGTITPTATGNYTFALASDDGSRAYLDNREIIDMWAPHALARKESEQHLEAGHTYQIKVEYFNAKDGAVVHFGWAKPGLPEEEKNRVTTADAVVFAGGFNPQSEHEAGDRPWDLPPSQTAELAQLLALNPHVITTINAGGNAGLGDNLAKIPALLWSWYPGQNGNTALGRILFGDINPSGHLPDTFEKRFEDSPAFGNYPGDTDGGPHVKLAEGIYVGYRWYDKKKIAPEFPFGFGMSYTGFAIKNVRSSGTDGVFDISADVTNTGARDGADVVQLYVRPVDSAIDRPVQELRAFQRVDLKAGETKTVVLHLTRQAFATFNEAKSAWVVPPGPYQLAVGDSSRDLTQTAKVKLTADQ